VAIVARETGAYRPSFGSVVSGPEATTPAISEWPAEQIAYVANPAAYPGMTCHTLE